MTTRPRICHTLFPLFLIFVCTLPVSAAPGGLAEQLRRFNFNVYSVPPPANQMMLQTIHGSPVDLNGLRGKVVILNFWRIDCPPCMTEKPILERVFRKNGHRGLAIVAVNLFDEEQRLRSFLQGKQFSFTFAFDPSNRFSLRRQNIGPGINTTFVVNPDSEAIYEVPGVPVTYVINRQGRVVGNMVGMVNWEQKPFADLLESLLGQAQSYAREDAGFDDAAQQGGPVANPRRAGPRRDQPGTVPESTGFPQPPMGVTGEGADTLPFQSPVTLEPDVAAPPAPGATLPSMNPGVPGPEPAPVVSPPPTQKKQKKAPTVKPEPSGSPPTAKRPKSQTTPGRITGAPPSGAPRPIEPLPHGVDGDLGGMPSAPTSSLPSGKPASVSSSLPAAMPYIPPRAAPGQPAPRQFAPDQDGTVMANVPPQGASRAGGYSAPQQPPEARPYGAPQQQGGRSPFDRFILDSFQRPQPATLQRPVAAAPPGQAGPHMPQQDDVPIRGQQVAPDQGPAQSFLGQLGRDLRNLGEGIRQSISGGGTSSQSQPVAPRPSQPQRQDSRAPY
jgi:thiol-disulfide isomerase/thioredoxin